MGKLVGMNLKKVRERRGIGQATVARRLGMKTAQSVSNIERGVSPLPITKVRGLAKILGLDPRTITIWMIAEYRRKIELTITR